jgi:thioredoxin reductase (NADPH)
MAKPALVVVYEDREVLAALDQALQTRFGADYQIIPAATPTVALDTLRQLRQAGEQVALVLADQWLAGMTGVEFLCQAHALHPTAKRGLFITYGDAAAGTAGLQAMALGQLDLYLNAPWGPPELQLYPAVSEALSQWARSTGTLGPPPELVRIVGPRFSPRSHEFRDLLARNSISHGFYDAESEDGRRLLAHAGLEAAGSPVLLLFDGRVLVDPPTDRLAQALGVQTRPTLGRYDVAVIGAGPAGLAAATYAASEGLRTLLLEREAVGGQAGTTSLIRNYLGFHAASAARSWPPARPSRRWCSAPSWSMPSPPPACDPPIRTGSCPWPTAARWPAAPWSSPPESATAACPFLAWRSCWAPGCSTAPR